jgi:hypothetical protein
LSGALSAFVPGGHETAAFYFATLTPLARSVFSSGVQSKNERARMTRQAIPCIVALNARNQGNADVFNRCSQYP